MKTKIENLRSISERLMAALPACCSTAFKRSVAATSVGSWQSMGVALRGGVLLLGCVVDAFADVTLLSIKHGVHDDDFRHRPFICRPCSSPIIVLFLKTRSMVARPAPMFLRESRLGAVDVLDDPITVPGSAGGRLQQQSLPLPQLELSGRRHCLRRGNL